MSGQTERQRRIDARSLGDGGGERTRSAKRSFTRTFRPGSDRNREDSVTGVPLKARQVHRDPFLSALPEGRKNVSHDHLDAHRPTPRSMTHGVLRMIMRSITMNVRKC